MANPDVCGRKFECFAGMDVRPLYLGMYGWAEQSGVERYFKWLRGIGDRESWQMGNRMYDANDVCVGQAFLDMYGKYKEKKMLEPVQARVDWVISQKDAGGKWWWCDALLWLRACIAVCMP